MISNIIYVGTACNIDHDGSCVNRGGLSISYDNGKTFVNRATANGLGASSVPGVYVANNTIYAGSIGGLSISHAEPYVDPTPTFQVTKSLYGGVKQ